MKTKVLLRSGDVVSLEVLRIKLFSTPQRLSSSLSIKGIPAICALSWSVVKIVVSEREGMHEAAHQVRMKAFESS